ncbi:hypothetical protein FAZ15_19945 [Sphingobacterium olei]|uniref:Lipoprotein n=1 Tax=Sphingobacterium olei TaxID=2571155 RepID=A0A4U0NE53_9SPHI|nr:hypothetical protein [Sphingobacterium olei]TJZ51822.1 hypothetical protein FAZ15_19945 [Sphingobacterium olei]
MRRIFYVLFALTFMGCGDNKNRVDNSTLVDTNKLNKQPSSMEIGQSDYKILPIDESGSDPTLVAFIDKLKKIVSEKDTSELFKSLDTAITVSYGGGIHGVIEFSKNWKLDRPEESELWKTLDQILTMGGTWENDGEYFCIPYAQSEKAFNKHTYDFDWYSTAVCISSDVTVYEQPRTNSLKIATLNYDIVEIDHEFTNSEFTKINTIDKRIEGYVKMGTLIHVAAPKLVIRKIDKKWKIAAFAPFD